MPVSRKRQKNVSTRPQTKAVKKPRGRYCSEAAQRVLVASSHVDPPAVLKKVMAKQGRTQGDLDALNMLMVVLALGSRAGDTVTFRRDALGLMTPLHGTADEQARNHLREAHGIIMTTRGDHEAWTLTPKVLTLARVLPLARLRAAWETRERFFRDAMQLLEAATAGGVDADRGVTVTYRHLTTTIQKSLSAVLDLEAYLVEVGVLASTHPVDGHDGQRRWCLSAAVLN